MRGRGKVESSDVGLVRLHVAGKAGRVIQLPDWPLITSISRAIDGAGGRALIVGGSVRDHLLNRGARGDVDVELLGISAQDATRVLARFGDVQAVGRAFAVLRLKGLNVDFSLPRASSAFGGARGGLARSDARLDFASAARRRDLTVNAMGLDPLTGEVLDPLAGRADLAAQRLRAADPALFGEDPLRGLRVARLAAQLGMRPDAELISLCRALDLSTVAPERLLAEWRKLLLVPRAPSAGLCVLDDLELIGFWPSLAALKGVPQDPRWHPEGDVWVHTLMVVDAAAALRRGDASDEALMFASLCHDLGKPATTEVVGGEVRSPRHEVVGAEVTREFLQTLRAPQALERCVAALVRHHLAPARFPSQGAGRSAYRRLARALHAAGASMELLERTARADQLGRTTTEALDGRFEAGRRFLEQAAAARVRDRAPEDVVQGRHLVARGYAPGPDFADLLTRCRAIQDDTGIEDPNRILDRLEGS